MKKIITALALLVFLNNLHSQTLVQGSIIPGSKPNSIYIVLRPINGAGFTGLFSNLQFTLQVPTSVGAAPNAVILSDPLRVAGFINGAWTQEMSTPATEVASAGSNYNYAFNVNPFGASPKTFTPGVAFNALEVQFTGPVVPVPNTTIKLAQIPNGGNTGNKNFYIEAANADKTNVSAFFYGASAPATTPLGYGGYYSVSQGGVVLPIKFTDFTAVRRNSDGLLSWTVANQDPNTSSYSIERSFNGSDFTTLGSVDANLVSSSAGTYNYTDVNIAGLRSSGIIYYRIKELDRDGHFVYSEIRSIKLDGKSVSINVYPNPAQAYTNLILDLQDAVTVAVSVTDVAGQTMQQFNFQGVKGNNQQRINLNKFAVGTYMIKVNAGDQMQTISVVKTN